MNSSRPETVPTFESRGRENGVREASISSGIRGILPSCFLRVTEDEEMDREREEERLALASGLAQNKIIMQLPLFGDVYSGPATNTPLSREHFFEQEQFRSA